MTSSEFVDEGIGQLVAILIVVGESAADDIVRILEAKTEGTPHCIRIIAVSRELVVVADGHPLIQVEPLNIRL